jgi:hypothetical protein
MIIGIGRDQWSGVIGLRQYPIHIRLLILQRGFHLELRRPEVPHPRNNLAGIFEPKSRSDTVTILEWTTTQLRPSALRAAVLM